MNDGPSDSQLLALLEGSLPDDEKEQLESLLETDPDLRARFEEIAGTQSFTSHFATDSQPKRDTPAISDVIKSLKGQSPGAPTSDLNHSRYLEPAPADAPQLLGKLGHYEVEEVIASGGMGIVYKARDPDLKRAVAIKLLSPILADSKDARQRFLREATSAAALEHPNIVAIHAVAKDAEIPYIVMRYIEGGTLQDRLDASQGAPLPLDEVLSIGKAVASALASAYNKNVIHRDIKPSNILLADSGSQVGNQSREIFLTDFGLARAKEESAFTRTGTFLGTPKFTSPEQAEGKETDHRSDLFSFGSVLYAIATGKTPFNGDSFASIAYQIVHQPHNSVRKANDNIPAWLAQVIDRLLSKNPDDRYQSADAALWCFENETADEPSEFAKGKEPQKKKTSLALAIAGVLLIVFAGFLFYPFESVEEHTPYTVLSETGANSGFADLATAIKSADDGDVIEIAPEGKLAMSESFSIDKFLIIRAAPGNTPVFLKTGEQPLFDVTAPLVLEGLTLIDETSAPSQPLVFVNDASVFLTNCKLVRVEESPESVVRIGRMIVRPLIWLQGSSNADIRRSEIHGPDSVLVLVQPGNPNTNHVQLIHTAGTLLPVVLARPAGASRLVTSVDRCAFSSRTLVQIVSNVGPLPIELEMTNSLLDSVGLLNITSYSRRERREMASILTWNGANNVYNFELGFLHGRPTQSRGIGNMGTLQDWNRYFGEIEPGSVELKHDFAYQPPKLPDGDLSSIEPASQLKVDLAPLIDAADIPSGFNPVDPSAVGPDYETTGPGIAYDNWRQTSKYDAWLAEAHERALQ